jgi:hypothetical protein
LLRALLNKIFPRRFSAEIFVGAGDGGTVGAAVGGRVGSSGMGVTLGERLELNVGGGTVAATSVGVAVALSLPCGGGGGVTVFPMAGTFCVGALAVNVASTRIVTAVSVPPASLVGTARCVGDGGLVGAGTPLHAATKSTITKANGSKNFIGLQSFEMQARVCAIREMSIPRARFLSS